LELKLATGGETTAETTIRKARTIARAGSGWVTWRWDFTAATTTKKPTTDSSV